MRLVFVLVCLLGLATLADAQVYYAAPPHPYQPLYQPGYHAVPPFAPIYQPGCPGGICPPGVCPPGGCPTCPTCPPYQYQPRAVYPGGCPGGVCPPPVYRRW